MEDCSLDQAPSVTAIVAAEKGERGRSIGCQLMCKPTLERGTLVMKVEVSMSKNSGTSWRFRRRA